MVKTPLLLRHEYTLDCYGQEYVDERTQCYHIAIAAQGTMLAPDGAWATWKALVEGHAVVNDKRFWFEERRPVKCPPGMNEAEAIIVLSAVFEAMQRGAVYSGDLCYMPIKLTKWLTTALHQDFALAAHVETVLRTAVNANNAILLN